MRLDCSFDGSWQPKKNTQKHPDPRPSGAGTDKDLGPGFQRSTGNRQRGGAEYGGESGEHCAGHDWPTAVPEAIEYGCFSCGGNSLYKATWRFGGRKRRTQQIPYILYRRNHWVRSRPQPQAVRAIAPSVATGVVFAWLQLLCAFGFFSGLSHAWQLPFLGAGTTLTHPTCTVGKEFSLCAALRAGLMTDRFGQSPTGQKLQPLTKWQNHKKSCPSHCFDILPLWSERE